MHLSKIVPEAELVSFTRPSTTAIPVVVVDPYAIKGVQWILPANQGKESSIGKSDKRLLEDGRDVPVLSVSAPVSTPP
jgi:hypothetical protein